MWVRQSVYYHANTAEEAEAILRGGFQDDEKGGVWLHAEPFIEGTNGEGITDSPFVILEVLLQGLEGDYAAYETWTRDGRWWHIPAAVVNAKRERITVPDLRLEVG